MQIVMYGKSLLEEGGGGQLSFNKPGVSKDQINSESNENLACKDGVQDPSLHPWGGLTTTREGVLTLTDCYLYSKSLKGLQNVSGCGVLCQCWIGNGILFILYCSRTDCKLYKGL